MPYRTLKTFPLIVVFFVITAFPCWAAFQKFIQPMVSVTQEYTDNLFLTEEDTEDEWITILSPGLSLEAVGQSFETRLTYEAGFSFYNEYDEFDSVRHFGEYELVKELSRRFTFSVFDTLTRTEEPYDRAELEEAEGETVQERIDYTLRRSREPRLSNAASARLDYAFGPRDIAFAEYTFGLVEDDDPEEEDSRRHNPEIGLTYWFTRHFGTEIGAGYTRGEFDPGDEVVEETEDFDLWDGSARLIRNFSRSLDGFVGYRHTYIDYDEDEDDYQVYEPNAGIDYRFHEYGTVSIAVGYYIQDYEEELEEDDESGYLVDGSVNMRWPLRRGAVLLRGESGYENTYFGTENLGFTVYYGGAAAVNYRLARRLEARLSGDYRYNKYTDVEPEREDHIATLEGGMRFTLLEWLFLDVSDVYRIVDSTEEGEDYKENRVIMTLTISPEPFRVD